MKNQVLKEISIVIILLIASCSIYVFCKQFAYYKVLSSDMLSPTTESLLSSFNSAVNITLFSQNEETYQKTKLFIERYQHIQPLIHFDWQKVTPQTLTLPQNALVLKYEQAKQVVDLEKTDLNENALTNALFKLHRKPNQWVVMLQGHGEPTLYGTSMRDFSFFRQALENQGLKIIPLNLRETPFIPDNASVLIIASPLHAFMPAEEQLILQYLNAGKDLLWLTDPKDHDTPFLNTYLGIFGLEGTIADKHGHLLGTPHPAITLVEKYPALPFDTPTSLSAFPFAKALRLQSQVNFSVQAFLNSHEESWTEKEIDAKTLSFDPDQNEIAGPLTLGYILTKSLENKQQRIIIIGNSRFLSNGAIENYGNLALGLNLISWLHHDDKLLHISQPIVTDSMLYLPFACVIAITYGFPSISLLLCIFSIFLMVKRKNRAPLL